MSAINLDIPTKPRRTIDYLRKHLGGEWVYCADEQTWVGRGGLVLVWKRCSVVGEGDSVTVQWGADIIGVTKYPHIGSLPSVVDWIARVHPVDGKPAP
jgi:hypothetical protein